MGKVVYDITVSLDGFIAGPNDGPEQPLGAGGMRLLDWYMSGPRPSQSSEFIRPSKGSLEVYDEAVAALGAILTGRRTYDLANGWGGEHPTHVPFVVLTHQPPEIPAGTTINGFFVTDGIDSAIRQAKATAGDKNVAIASPNVAEQALRAGLLDEISIHLVPLLLGGGIRLLDPPGPEPVALEPARCVDAECVTHLTFRVVKTAGG